MKRWTLGLLVLTLCAAPATASSLGVFASTYSPDATGEGEGFGFDLRLGSGPVEFELRMTIYEELETTATVVPLSIEAVPIDFGVNYRFGGGRRAHPYIGGGASYVVLDYDVDITILNPQRTTDIDPEWGYYGQIGVDFDLNDQSHVFVQAIYRTFEAEAEEDDLGLEIDRGLNMKGGAFNLGFAFTW